MLETASRRSCAPGLSVAKRRTPVMTRPAKQVCENRVRLCSSAATHSKHKTGSGRPPQRRTGYRAVEHQPPCGPRSFHMLSIYFIETEAVVPDGLWYVNISV